MSPSESLLSPKDLAAAIGASESSLRRWIDSGDIRVSRTAGGHRRIPLADAIQFIRKMGAVVVRPEMLKLPALPQEATAADARGESEEQLLFTALRDDRRDVARGLMLSWYLQGRSLHALFDGQLRGAMYLLGELWKHEERGILIEHRATEVSLAIINALKALLPPPPPEAPLAL